MERACGYGRVSTEEETQLNALAIQIEEINGCISKNDWIKTDMYIDEGKSGTSTKKRNEYNRLMNDMVLDKWDIIVVKSQDRLMRSAKDWYIFVDSLVKNNKLFYFYIDNKLYTPDDYIITGIKAILAYDYSRELSKKENNAHRTRRLNAAQSGTDDGMRVILTNNTWGYNKINKKVVINEEEAKIVREIYNLAAYDNYGSRLISKYLSEKGVVGKNGNTIAEGVVRRIIRNPLYKGVVVMNKKSYDFATKQWHYNKEEEIVYIKDGVPRIVDDDVWSLANSNMDSRSKKMKSDIYSKQRIGVKIGQNKYSGKVFCGECNMLFWLKNRRLKSTNEKITEWYCSNFIRQGKSMCSNVHLSECMLDKLMIRLSEKILNEDYEKEFDYVIKTIQTIISDSDIENEVKNIRGKINDINRRKNNILDKFVDGIIDEDTYKEASNRYMNEKSKYEERLSRLDEEIEGIKNQEKRLNDIRDRFDSIKKNHELNSTDIVRFIKKIIVYKDYVIIEMEIGVSYKVPFKIITSSRRYTKGKASNDIQFL